MPNRIALIGAGPLGLNVAGVVRRSLDHELVGFIDNKKGPVAGIAVLGDDSVLDDLLHDGVRQLVVCIGDSKRRVKIGGELRERGFELPALVHPTADVGIGVRLGIGTIVLPGAVILPESDFGEFCVVEAGCFVGHHSRCGKGTLVGGRALVGNRVTLGEEVNIGMGAAVRSGSHVPAGTRIAEFEAWEESLAIGRG
jgi:acetyltransferase-like isoleucine patch superfamily enzyme